MFGASKIVTMATGGGAANTLTYSYVSNNNISGLGITIPTVQTGDIGIYFNFASASSSTIPTAVTPSGWTNAANTTFSVGGGSPSACRSMVHYKTMNSSDSATTLTGMDGRNLLIFYRPNRTVSTYTVSALTQQATSSAPTNQTLAMSGVSGPYIGLAFYASTTSITTKGSTVTATRDAGAATTYAAKTFEATSSSVSFSSSTISQTDDGINALISFILGLA